MSHFLNFKLASSSHKTYPWKIIFNFFSGAIGVAIGLVIGNYLGWL